MQFSKYAVSGQGINFAKVYSVHEALKDAPDYGSNNNGRSWNQAVNTYATSQQVEVVPNCFGYMFTNRGDTPVLVNGMIVFPSATPLTALGDSRTMSGHWLDMYTGRLDIVFAQPVGPAPLLEIVQIFYLVGDCKIKQA